MTDFSTAVAFITGGASGIGAATARALAERGTRVVVGDVQYAQAHAVAESCGGIAVMCDVRNDAEVASAIAHTIRTYGKLDLAVNAAGIGGDEQRTADYLPEMWELVLDVNLTGVWRSMRHQIPAMLAGSGGVIVNVASIAGLQGFPKHPAYAASKHGVIGLTRTAALEYIRRGVRINALCPGFTHTPMVQAMFDAGLPPTALAARVPAARLGTAEEIAESAVYLCSSASAFMVGHALAVDGGLSAG